MLGFVGNTGDAVTTWPHVHFEVHPNALLYLGYDGAVDPTHYLSRLGAARPRRLGAAAGAAAVRRAPRGEGALKDFRALLAIRPMKVPRRAAGGASPAAAPKEHTQRTGATAISVAIATTHGNRDGYGAILAGVALLGGALGALALTSRAGRSG